MGTRKGPKPTTSSNFPSTDDRSLSNSKDSALVAQTTTSQQCPPVPSVVEHLTLYRPWEHWEDQLIIDGHKAGKTMKEISHDLPGRSQRGCRDRWNDVLQSRSQSSQSPQKDALSSRAPKKCYWRKEWEDWEDEIVATHHLAGESWQDISKRLPPRSAACVSIRWSNMLKPQYQKAAYPQVRSLNTRSVSGARKPKDRWTQAEEILLKSLHESGKNWIEIASQLPGRSAGSCKGHWWHVRQRQGLCKTNASHWKEWEERLLVSGYYAGLSWQEITEPITTRKLYTIRRHWLDCFESTDRDDSWTSEELTLLTNLRSEGGSWDGISQAIPGHTSNACRRQ